MRLSELLKDITYTCLQGDENQEITQLLMDSRKACEGGVYVCIVGAVRDGHDFARDVVEQGVKALIVEHPVSVPKDITVIQVENTRYALACMSAAYFGYPDRELITLRMYRELVTRSMEYARYLCEDGIRQEEIQEVYASIEADLLRIEQQATQNVRQEIAAIRGLLEGADELISSGYTDV